MPSNFARTYVVVDEGAKGFLCVTRDDRPKISSVMRE